MEKIHKNLLDKSLEQFNYSVVPKIPVLEGNDSNMVAVQITKINAESEFKDE